MSTWWVTSTLDSPNGPILLTSWVIWVIGSIVLHELGHGWAALSCGDDTPRLSGHMTWNPLVHMGWMSLIVFALLGIAWGAMPVNPARFRGRYDDVIVSLAGPMMNVALALACILGCALWIPIATGAWFGAAVPSALGYNLEMFLRVGAMLNVTLALFNLLPVPPLDGSRVLLAFFPGLARALMGTELGRLAMVIVFVLIFTGGSGVVFSLAARASNRAIESALRLTMPGAPSPAPASPFGP